MDEESRALRGLGKSGFELLAQELTGSELHSVLLAVMQRRARGRSGAGTQLIALRFRRS